MKKINLTVKLKVLVKKIKPKIVYKILKQYDISSHHLILTYNMLFKTYAN